MRNATDHRLGQARALVFEAAEVAWRAIASFPPEIQELALRQMEVDLQIRSTVTSMAERESARVKNAPQSSNSANLGPYTIAQVAERCHVSEEGVKRWLRLGSLKRTKAGSRTLVTEDDLQDFLRRSTDRMQDKAKRGRDGQLASCSLAARQRTGT